jgi:hypothetical protein
VPAIGGLDDHARGLRVRGRVHSPLPHSRTFRLLRTHLVCDRVLTGDVDRDGPTLIRALAAGAAWLHCPFVAPADGARFWAERRDGTTVSMGGESRAGPIVLRLTLPRHAAVSLIRDGRAIHEARGAVVDLEVELPGVYRVEARIDGRLWLLSNPIHLRARP